VPLAAIALTWGLTRSGRSGIPWHLQPTVNIAGVVLTVLLVTAVGVIATWDVMTRKPIVTLREQ
jgi:hypothetical protein